MRIVCHKLEFDKRQMEEIMCEHVNIWSNGDSWYVLVCFRLAELCTRFFVLLIFHIVNK